MKIANSAEPAAVRDALEKIQKFPRRPPASSISPRRTTTGLTEEAFVMVKITKGDWEMLK